MVKIHMLFEPRSRHLWRLLLTALLAVVAWYAFKPVEADDGIEHLDKVRHVMAFLSLACAAALGWAPGTRTGARIAAALLAYGLLIEGVQTLLPTRSGSVADWLADAVGVALGLWLARRLRPPD